MSLPEAFRKGRFLFALPLPRTDTLLAVQRHVVTSRTGGEEDPRSNGVRAAIIFLSCPAPDSLFCEKNNLFFG